MRRLGVLITWIILVAASRAENCLPNYNQSFLLQPTIGPGTALLNYENYPIHRSKSTHLVEKNQVAFSLGQPLKYPRRRALIAALPLQRALQVLRITQ